MIFVEVAILRRVLNVSQHDYFLFEDRGLEPKRLRNHLDYGEEL